MSIRTDHVQSSVAAAIAHVGETVGAELFDELFDVVEVAVAAGEQELIVVLVGRRGRGRHE